MDESIGYRPTTVEELTAKVAREFFVELVPHGELAALKERDRAIEERDHWKVEADRLANGPPTQHSPKFVARILMSRQGRDDPLELAQLTEVIRCARLDGRKQARDESLALKERDEARAALAEAKRTIESLSAWMVRDSNELTELRAMSQRIAERDASVVRAVRAG